MYRAITLYFLRNHIGWTDSEAVVDALKDINIEFIHNDSTRSSEVLLNDENVEYLIRDLVVAEKVSEVAAIKEVRDYAVSQQQALGTKKAIVMDGRDIGTIVFPDAELKIFMTADKAVRVERRFRELYEKNPKISLEEVKNNLEMRDYIDSHREISPLRKADDAIVLDNSNLTEQEQYQLALKWSNEKIKLRFTFSIWEVWGVIFSFTILITVNCQPPTSTKKISMPSSSAPGPNGLAAAITCRKPVCLY
jgi:cytidylate kinase